MSPDSPAKPKDKKETKQPEQQPAKQQKAAQIIRFAETNIDATKPVIAGIRNVRGISHVMANAIVSRMGMRGRKINELGEAELAQVEKAVYNPESLGIPLWMVNRRKDWTDGTDRHLIASKLEFAVRNDINRMKKMRTYKGMRHSAGQPVRGQRTRSSFRKGTIVGVTKKKEEPAKAGAAKEGEKK